jgi:D-threonate/D-erythronate kinase
MNRSRQIVVIADDLSGAAELAGAAAGQGFKAEVHTIFNSASEATVIAVDTDSRSLSANEARRNLEEVARSVAAVSPAWIYKKCDSVLRGNVLPEIRGIMEGAGKKRAVLISANPFRNRVVRKGIYYVDEKPLAETVFARDPEHPRRTSVVKELLGGGLDGVETPDAQSEADLITAADQLDPDTLPAGGVDFFNVLLKREQRERAVDDPMRGRVGVILFVCGSAAAWNAKREQEFRSDGYPVTPMPTGLFKREYEARWMNQWVAQTADALGRNNAALIGIGNAALPEIPGSELVRRLAMAVRLLLTRLPVSRLFLEGGATAAACIHELGLSRFRAFPGAYGVGTLEPHASPGQIWFIKPGSYDWPAELQPHFSLKPQAKIP